MTDPRIAALAEALTEVHIGQPAEIARLRKIEEAARALDKAWWIVDETEDPLRVRYHSDLILFLRDLRAVLAPR